MVREARNANKIEHWRLSKVPINGAETIFQGDMMAWDVAAKRATKLVTAASGSGFMGVSDYSNPVTPAGILSADQQLARINLLQSGLVEMIFGETGTVYPFDILTVGVDAQTVIKTGATTANQVGKADSSYGSAGKAMVAGDPILMWMTVKDAYNSHI